MPHLFGLKGLALKYILVRAAISTVLVNSIMGETTSLVGAPHSSRHRAFVLFIPLLSAVLLCASAHHQTTLHTRMLDTRPRLFHPLQMSTPAHNSVPHKPDLYQSKKNGAK